MFKFNVKEIDINYEFIIDKASTISHPKNNSILFLKKDNIELLENLRNIKNCLIILNKKLKSSWLEKNNLVIYCDNARLEYAKILTEILEKNKKEIKWFYSKGYYYGENVYFGKNIKIENFVKIGNNVKIGDNTVIKAGTKIGDCVTIGKNCYIGENSVVGTVGYGLEEDIETNRKIRIPHIGGLIIEDNVQIGALTSIQLGTIEPTIIKKNVVISDRVTIAHNDYINEGTSIATGTSLSGSIYIGKNCWLAPGMTITNSVKIGDNVTFGMGARVVSDIESNLVVTNEKADTLENIRMFSKWKNNLLGKLKEKK